MQNIFIVVILAHESICACDVDEGHITFVTSSFTYCAHSDQPVSYSLCRHLPTDHVSGQLLFRVDITSNGHEGVFHNVSFNGHFCVANVALPCIHSEASPDAMGTILGSTVNGDPGSPSDDEDLPQPSSSSRVTCGLSPTGSDEGSLLVNGACYYGDDSVWHEPGQIGEEALLPVALGGYAHRQVSLNDYLDAIESPMSPGDRPLAGPSPKLRSSFPTDTRLNAMLHIDSDEDEETAGQQSTDVSSKRSAASVSRQGNESSKGEPPTQPRAGIGPGAGATLEAGSSAAAKPLTETAESKVGPADGAAQTPSDASAPTGEAIGALAEMVHVAGETLTASGAEAAACPAESVRECTCQEHSRTEAPCSPTRGPLSPIQVSICKLGEWRAEILQHLLQQ